MKKSTLFAFAVLTALNVSVLGSVSAHASISQEFAQQFVGSYTWIGSGGSYCPETLNISLEGNSLFLLAAANIQIDGPEVSKHIFSNTLVYKSSGGVFSVLLPIREGSIRETYNLSDDGHLTLNHESDGVKNPTDCVYTRN